MLDVDLVAVLHKPVRSLLDLRFGHEVVVGVCDHRLIDNAGDIVARAVHLDDASVGLEALTAVRFLLCEKELLLISSLVNEGHELDLGVRDLNGLFHIAHFSLTSFSA